jgi:hypothetical protein
MTTWTSDSGFVVETISLSCVAEAKNQNLRSYGDRPRNGECFVVKQSGYYIGRAHDIEELSHLVPIDQLKEVT